MNKQYTTKIMSFLKLIWDKRLPPLEIQRKFLIKCLSENFRVRLVPATEAISQKKQDARCFLDKRSGTSSKTFLFFIKRFLAPNRSTLLRKKNCSLRHFPGKGHDLPPTKFSGSETKNSVREFHAPIFGLPKFSQTEVYSLHKKVKPTMFSGTETKKII